MGRIVDERRHTERRDAILSEAYRQFATSGYDRTSTASICRGAGISSGTFFHYFPTKLDALVGVLTAGLQQTRQALSRIESDGSGLAAVLAYAGGVQTEMADPHFGGFVHAVAGVELLPEVAAVLDDESTLIRAFLVRHLADASARAEIRTDASPEHLARWTQWLLDGAAQHATTPDSQPGDAVEAVRALLTPP
ncbi:TetR/AcrR family transcriptional regulator [Paractinoplanes hotanensis]|uniref:TetR/AcrR family transcriptional regulator n=1 Tax=Paractinoplanes hotanensis TaxID=2906497 RepID=A0ABT0Y7X1_9ACTN|nr:TetR/AcrR family transcriptional regulator [Actinoplanes hotanensis]MCM4082134.1 TetR/AcrR family transcriptional regulator [Actinoplanes hotanensis]